VPVFDLVIGHSEKLSLEKVRKNLEKVWKFIFKIA